jgi:hypothetical protein
VGQKVVEVDVVATEGVVAVAGNGLDPSVNAGRVTELRITVSVVEAELSGPGPLGL